jgi:pyruvate kinase
MARDIARFRPPVWIVAFSPNEATCQALQFSYGVHPVLVDTPPLSWPRFVRSWLADHGYRHGLALLTQGPNDQDPCANHRLEILELDGDTACP